MDAGAFNSWVRAVLLGALVAAQFQSLPSAVGAVRMGSGAMPDEPVGPSRGDSYSPSISADGRYVTFGSLADDLTTDSPDAVADVFRYDRQTGELVLVSNANLPPLGLKAPTRSLTVSADGQKVAYIADTDMLFPQQRPQPATVVRNLAVGTTTVLAKPEWPPGYFYPGYPQTLLLAAGGEHLFIGVIGGTGVTNSSMYSNIRVFRIAEGTLYGVEQPRPLLYGTNPFPPVPTDLNMAATPDGSFLAFQSIGTSLPGVMREEIMVFDAETETVVQASVHQMEDSDILGSSFRPAISDNGRWIAYESRATNLLATGATGPGRKVLLHDRQSQTTVLVSSNQLGVASADRDSAAVALSGDGNWTAFFSDADDLVLGDSNGVGDVFLRDNQSGEVRCISTHAAWNGQMARSAIAPAISPDGEWVLYQAPGSGVFLHQQSTGANTLITTDCEADVASMTPDGNLVAFTAKAKTIDSFSSINARNVYIWARESGEVELITRRHPGYDRALPDFNSHLYAGGVSGDGSRFVFRSSARNLSADQPDAYEALWVRDLTLGTNILIAVHDGNFRGSGPRPFSEAVISGNGRYVAYLAQRTNLPPEGLALPGWNDVFVRELETGQQYLVTESRSGSFAGSGNSSKLGISWDGGRVLFTSEATNLSADPGGSLRMFVWDRGSDSIRRMDDPSVGPLIHYCADKPALLSRDGSTLAFIASNPNNGNCVLHVRGWNDVASTIIDQNMTVSAFAWNASGAQMALIGRGPMSPGASYWAFIYDLATRQIAQKSAYVHFGDLGLSFDASLRYLACIEAYNVSHIAVRVWDTDAGQMLEHPGFPYFGPLRDQGTSMSPDGRFVVFRSGRLQPGGPLVVADENRIHLRILDRINGTIIILDRSIHDGTVFDVPPGRFVMAPNASRVFFESYQPDLVGRDNNLAMDIFVVDLISQDSDNDGMADDWEMAYFDNLDRDGSGDSDGDTIADLSEYTAGTVPINSTSVLSVTEIRVVNTSNRQLSWRSVTGRRYRVQMKPDVDAPDWLDRSGVIAATMETTSFTDSPEAGAELPATRYYRVVMVE